jgi:ribosomal-protein-alanine N-acetyltransferase
MHQQYDYRLLTDRLQLEPIGTSDLVMLHALLTDESVRKYLFDEQVIPISHTAQILETSRDTFVRHRYGLWLVYTKKHWEPVGFVGLYTFFSEPQPQLLYALLPQYQRQGFASEASGRVVRYAFEALGFAYLKASCDRPNVASVRVMERLGMWWQKEECIEDKPIVFYHLDRAGYHLMQQEKPVN